MENTGLCWLATSRRTWAGSCRARLASVRCDAYAELCVVDDDRGGGRQVRQVAGERVHELRGVPRRPLHDQRRVTAHGGPPRSKAGSEPGPGNPVSVASSQDRPPATNLPRPSSWPTPSRLVLPKPEGGPPGAPAAPAADLSLRSRTARCTRGPAGLGTPGSRLWTDRPLSVSMALPPVAWDARPAVHGHFARPGAARFTLPPRVIPGDARTPPAAESGRERHARRV